MKTGLFVRVTGRSGVHFLVAVFFPVAMIIAAAALMGGGVAAEDDGGPTPPAEGDWNVTDDTTVDGMHLNVSGNITVFRGVSLCIVNSTVNVRTFIPHKYELRVEAGASLHVNNSTLDLDTFASDTQSSLVFEGDSLVKTRGRFLARSNSFFATDTTFLNTAHQPTERNRSGEDAIFIANGVVNSECLRVTIINAASDATPPAPGCDGLPGGDAVFISKVTTWIECVIECRAGRPSGGGLGLTGTGGDGAPGGDASVQLSTRYLEGTVIVSSASGGGHGASGANAPSGDGGDGGDGGMGGNATIELRGSPDLEIHDCTLSVTSGDGGSGGNGGQASDGDAGNGGQGADAGIATLEMDCDGAIVIEGSNLEVRGGSGGYGGDYGRHISGEGTSGLPSSAGCGGPANLVVMSDVSIVLEDCGLLAQGGFANDGGNGEYQGAVGGRGGDASLRVWTKGYLDAETTSMEAIGGRGGNGGAAVSDINGNGGDGGDAFIELSGLSGMDVRKFSIKVTEGSGGKGYKPLYDGSYGTPTFDLETIDLWMEDGTLNMPLDDLSGNARGQLFDPVFDLSFGGIHVLPIDNAEVTESYTVTVIVIDDADHVIARPLVGWRVDVYSIDTGQLVDSDVTDEDGKCTFILPSYHYTSLEVQFLGDYHFIATSPDGKVSKKVRGTITEPTTVRIVVVTSPPIPHITIENPKHNEQVLIRPGEDAYLKTWGSVYYERPDLKVISVHLHPKEGTPALWPAVNLSRDYHPVKWLSGDDPPEDYPAWGNFSHSSSEAHRYYFCLRYDPFSGDLPFTNGTYVLEVKAFTEYTWNSRVVEFDLVLDPNAGRPLVIVGTIIEGKTFYGKPVEIRGEALDDWQLVSVEMRVDGGPWIAVNGTGEWDFVLDTANLADDQHEVTFRAYDGEHHSRTLSYTFFVDKPASMDPDGEDGGGGEGVSSVISMALLVAVLTALVVLLATLYIKRRHREQAG